MSKIIAENVNVYYGSKQALFDVSWAALAQEAAKDGALVPNPYKNWSDIDSSLPNYPIKVMVPPGTSGTRDAWNKWCSEDS